MTALGMFDGAESNGINFIYVIIVASEAERSEASSQSMPRFARQVSSCTEGEWKQLDISKAVHFRHMVHG